MQQALPLPPKVQGSLATAQVTENPVWALCRGHRGGHLPKLSTSLLIGRTSRGLNGSLHGAPSRVCGIPWASGRGWFLALEMGRVEGSLGAPHQKGDGSSDTPDKTILYGVHLPLSRGALA